MKTRQLGKTDIWVTPVALGCWPIAGMTSLNVNDEDSLKTIHAALDNGINFLDTAFCYGADGESDRLIAKAVEGRRDEVVIATKGGIHWKSPTTRVNDATPVRLKQECEESLKRLGVETIDLLYLHSPDPKVPVAESATAYESLLAEGKIRSVGASNLTLEQLKSFHEVCRLTAFQPPYNMLQRGIEEEVVPWCIQNDVSIINYWPLMKGLLAGKIRRGHQFDPQDKRLTYEIFQGQAFERAQTLLDLLDQIAKTESKTVAQVVVNWTMNRPGILSTLCGAKRDWQIFETAGAMGWELSPESRQLICQHLNVIES